MLCRVMKVSTSAYYAACLKPIGSIDAYQFRLEAKVKTLFSKHNQRIGSRQMVGLLKNEGFNIGRYLARKIMKKLNLHCLQRKSRPNSYKGKSYRSKVNLLNQCFDPLFPNEGWAGPGFGTIALPRIGQEVIVSYLEGDPDKPIITGRTYHATNRQPYQLPANKTITGLRTKTHKGEGYNELYFDDQTDEQLINVRAEKNMNILVQNVKKERVDFDRFTSIGNNENIAIANDRILTVDGEHNLKTTGNHMDLRAADSSLEITGDFAQSIDGNLGIKVNNHIVLESTQQITLKVGGSFVVIHSGGVHIQGSTVTINSGGTPAMWSPQLLLKY